MPLVSCVCCIHMSQHVESTRAVPCMLCLQEGSAEFVGYRDAVLTQLLAGGHSASRLHAGTVVTVCRTFLSQC
jgi:hypothetical protein